MQWGAKAHRTIAAVHPELTAQSREKSRESPRESRLPALLPIIILDSGRPVMTARSETIKPAIGPDAPMSISASLVVMGDFIFINAPKVPINVGAE